MIHYVCRRFIALAFLLSNLTGCSTASQRALEYLSKGDQCEFCKISFQSVPDDHASYNNLGVCYQNGWCGYTVNLDMAVANYTMAARWNIPEAAANLKKLGIPPPAADLYAANEKEKQIIAGKVIAAALLVGFAVISAKQSSNSYSSPSSPSNNFLNKPDLQGCCSWHGGISRNYLGEAECHLTGMVLCKDFQPSPTCRCN